MRSVIHPGAIVVPAAATIYCVGVEAMSSKVDGFDLSPINKYRWVIDVHAADSAYCQNSSLCKFPALCGEHGLWNIVQVG